jgi:hypothetical protein
MRLWSIHPKYLDALGLTALWREALLARRVLEGATKGYRSHPQLDRFLRARNPAEAADGYLRSVFAEAKKRGYKFDGTKLYGGSAPRTKITVSAGQLAYEFAHLQKKLKKRSPLFFKKNLAVIKPAPHPLFKIKPGGVEPWEKTGGTQIK